MPKVVTSTELQKNTHNVIDWTRSEDEAIIVEISGEPMAAILSFDEYRNYLKYKQKQRETRTRFERLRQFAEQNAAFGGLNEEEALTLVEKAREEVYQLKQEKAARS